MATKRTSNITEVGPMRYNQLQQENLLNPNLSSEYKEELRKIDAMGYAPSASDIGIFGDNVGIQSSLYGTNRQWGESRYDDEVANAYEFDNLEDTRANKQSDLNKLVSGVSKGVVLAATTFADGIVGTITGLANTTGYLIAGEDADEDGNTDKRTWSGALNAFVNNPISNALQQVNKWSEELLPNYYTQDELNNPWKYVFNANFLGDKLFKNIGFLVGAAYSGKVGAATLGNLANVGKIRDVFRGSVVAAGLGGADKVDDVAKALLKGDKVIDSAKLTERLARQAKQLKTAETWMKLAGGVSGAMGEARIEAINASDEWSKPMLDEAKQVLDTQLNRGGIEYDMASDIEHPEWFEMKLQMLPDGQIRYIRQLSEAGKQEYEIRKINAQEQYKQAVELIGKKSAQVANKVFLTELPFLAFGEILQFGKFFAGGYRTGRTALNNTALKAAKWAADGTGKLTKKDIVQGVGKAAFNVFWQGEEEVVQAGISDASKVNASSYINSFYGRKIDPQASLEIESYGESLMKEMVNAHKDEDVAMERLIGSMTAVLGIPSFSKVKAENSKNKVKFNGIQGGLFGDITDIWKDRKEAQSAIDAVNNAIKSENFTNVVSGNVRHKSINNDLDLFLKQGKEFNYKNSELSEFLNYTIMFSKVGRTQDLIDRIEEAGTVNPEDVANIREMTKSLETGKSIYDGMTDEQVIEHIAKQKNDYIDKLKSYQEISTNLKTLYGENIDNDTLEEMTWMTTQIGDWEKRGKSLYDEIIEPLKSKIQEIEDKTGEKIDLNSFDYLDLMNVFNRDEEGNFTSDILNTVFKINEISNNYNLSLEEQNDKIQEEISALNNKVNKTRTATARAIKEARRKGLSEEVINKIRKRRNRYYTNRKKDLLFNIGILNEYIKQNKDNEISPLAAKEMNSKMNDFIKIGAARALFINKLNMLAKNPSVFSQEVMDMNRAAYQDLMNKKVDEVAIKAMAATNQSELSDILNDADVDEDAVLEKLAKEGSPETKKLATNYRQMKQGTKVMEDILHNLDTNDNVVISASNIIRAAFQNSDNIEQALAIIEADLQTAIKDEAVKNAIRTILNKYNSQMKSTKLTEKDSNTANGPQSKKVDSNEAKSQENTLPGLSSNPVENTDKEEFTSEDEKETVPPLSPNDKPISVEEIVDENTESKDDDVEESKDVSGEYTKQKKAKEATPNVHQSSSKELKNQNSEKDSQDAAHIKLQGLRSWFESKFNIESLKKLKKAISRVLQSNIVKALDDLGMYDYVDSGKLGDKLYKNPKLPIYLIRYEDSRLGDNKVLLAIRLEEREENVNAITGQDGNRYQIVGHLNYNPNNKAAKDNYYAIRSEVNRQYKESDDSPTAFVSSLTTTVSHIYSGRMVTSDDSDSNNTPRQRNVNSDFLGNTPFHLGVLYTDTDFVTPSIDRADSRVQSPNTNNKNPREGTVWLMVKGADGIYYPKAVTIKRFTASEYSLDDYYDSPFVNEIKKQLAVLLNPRTSHYDKSLAKFALKDLLFFPEGNDLVFKEGSSLVSVAGLANNIGNVTKEMTMEEAINNALRTLQSLGLRIQIATRKLSDSSYRDMILSSELLTTDLLYPKNVNSSFDVNPIDINSGKPIETGENAEVGHTGKQGVNTSLTATTFTFEGKQYRQVEGELPVLIESLSKEDSSIAGSMILSIMNGDNSTKVKGTTNIFEKVVNNSGKTIALRRNKSGGFELISQEELANIKKKVEENIKNKQRKEEAKKLEEENKKKQEDLGLPGLSNTYQVNDDEDISNSPQQSSNNTSVENKAVKKQDVSKSDKPTNALDSKKSSNKSYTQVFSSDTVDVVMEEAGLETFDLQTIYEQHKDKLKDPTTIDNEQDAIAWLETYQKCIK